MKIKNYDSTGFSRRNFISRALGGGVACAVAGAIILPLSSVSKPVLGQPTFSVTPLKNNLSIISSSGGNVLVAAHMEQTCVVDGGKKSEAEALLEVIQGIADGPISTLFNSNWRPHHCGLNYLLGPEGASIIAHENTRLWQNNDFVVDWEERHYTPIPKAAQANQTFYKGGSLDLGSETVEYGRISEFHTDGDMYVHFRESNVLYVGDMMAVGEYPLLDYITGGWIGGAQKCTAQLLEMCDEETLIVPAAGPVQGKAALQDQQLMLDHAYEMVANAYRTGRSLDQFMETAPMADYDDVYGNADLFTELLYRGTWYHVPGRAIRGII